MCGYIVGLRGSCKSNENRARSEDWMLSSWPSSDNERVGEWIESATECRRKGGEGDEEVACIGTHQVS